MSYRHFLPPQCNNEINLILEEIEEKQAANQRRLDFAARLKSWQQNGGIKK